MGLKVSSYKLIEAKKTNFSIPLMCRILGVSKSGYYDWRNRTPSARSRAEAELNREDRGDPPAQPTNLRLTEQTAALRARHGIRAEADFCNEPEAPLEVKETLYRIAQEALHNTVKHARANNVEIEMECDPQWITLEVSDDGVGFEARGDFPGHLGLRSMRERATRPGGKLSIESAPGEGSRIPVK